MNKLYSRISLMVFLILMVCPGFTFGQTQRALLIGIGQYLKEGETKDTRFVCRKTGIKDLKCAENDLSNVQSLLSVNFGFGKEQIIVLKNKDATRRAILDAVDQALKDCTSGDVFVFYYSGHGSMRPNPLSLEKDLMNETIVPADGIYQGADIQDKELAMRFQQFVDKGVILTVIIDSCHSGSIARGTQIEIKSTDAPDIEYKSMDESTDEINDPFLYVNPASSGALVLSAAQDYQQAQGMVFPDGKYYSSFTKTLVDVLKLSKTETTVEQVFDATTAKMRYSGIAQIPVLEANAMRRSASIFGRTVPVHQPSFPVLKVTTEKNILLEAGPAVGIEVGSVLVNQKLGVTIEVKATTGINSSLCKTLKGTMVEVKAGTMFEIVKRGSSGKKDNLRLYIPHVSYSKDSLLKLHSDQIEMISEIPLYDVMFQSLKKSLEENYSSVELTDRDLADYCIVGLLKRGQLSYQLVRNLPVSDPTDPYARKSEAWQIQNDNETLVAAKLSEAAYKLSRTKGWLTLESASEFSYHLAIRRNNEKDLIRGGDVCDKDQVHIYLKREPGSDSTRHYIYVFGISSDGSIQLIFPLNRSNVENFLPINPQDELIEICTPSISAPFGTDHLVMLATKEPIINPGMIAQSGVATKGTGGMDELISSMNSNSKAPIAKGAVGKYYLDRISLKSHEKR